MGFTLAELLVVSTIIGILTALVVPALSKAKAHARSAICKNHLHQMGLGLQMYVDDYQGRYPYYRGCPDPAYDAAVGADNTGFWWAKLLHYYPLKWTDPGYHCPGYKGAIQGTIARPHSWTHPLGSYAYNAKGATVGPWIKTNDLTLGLGGRLSFRNHTFGVASEDQVRVPSEMFAIGESRCKRGEGYEGGLDYMQCGFLSAKDRHAIPFDPARHGKNYNQLFCDGHVSAMSPWVLFSPTNTAAMWNYDHQPHPEYWLKYQ